MRDRCPNCQGVLNITDTEWSHEEYCLDACGYELAEKFEQLRPVVTNDFEPRKKRK